MPPFEPPWPPSDRPMTDYPLHEAPCELYLGMFTCSLGDCPLHLNELIRFLRARESWQEHDGVIFLAPRNPRDLEHHTYVLWPLHLFNGFTRNEP